MEDPEDEKELLNVELGNKMVLLMDILKESYLIGIESQKEWGQLK